MFSPDTLIRCPSRQALLTPLIAARDKTHLCDDELEVIPKRLKD
jgi:hypothetical protein